MLTIRGQVRYTTPPPAPASERDRLEERKRHLLMERDRVMREVRRIEGLIWGIDRAIELLSAESAL